MLTPQREPLHRKLDNGCTLHTLRGPADVAALAAFGAGIFGKEVGGMMENMLTHHPGVEPADQFFVTDQAGRIISSLCLIAWTWRYGAVDLPVGEMGIVATDPAYRRQGLVRVQVEHFKQRLAERGCLLSCIQGIPYYYRQFGYEYTLPLEGGWRIELRHIPDPPSHGYRIRRATLDDAPRLAALYEQAIAGLTPHPVRSAAHWRYLLQTTSLDDAGVHQTWVLTTDASNTDADPPNADTIVAYVRLPEYHFGDDLTVDEASRFPLDAAQVMLAHLRDLAQAANQPAIRLNLPAQSDLVQIARALDAHDLGTYAWQIYIPDVLKLLDAIRPTLSARLAGSVFQQHTGRLRVGFYRDGAALIFEAGQVVAVEPLGVGDETDCTLPPMALAPLILGQRSIEELRHAYPDVSVRGLHKLLLDTLFPRTPAFIFPQY